MSRSDNDLFDTPADPFKHGKTDTIPPDAHIDHAAALAYWSSISPDVNGMLGGYPQISRIDLRGSANFLIKLRRRFGSDSDSALFPRGVDCGAGIGRVTKGFLAGVCELVDLVEPVERFAWEVEYGEEMTGLRHQGKIGKVYMTPLETWEPEPEMYHLIWNQWCLGHLTDTQLVAYLSRCAGALKKGGWVIIKENMSTDANKEDIYDPQDNSVTRYGFGPEGHPGA